MHGIWSDDFRDDSPIFSWNWLSDAFLVEITIFGYFFRFQQNSEQKRFSWFFSEISVIIFSKTNFFQNWWYFLILLIRKNHQISKILLFEKIITKILKFLWLYCRKSKKHKIVCFFLISVIIFSTNNIFKNWGFFLISKVRKNTQFWKVFVLEKISTEILKFLKIIRNRGFAQKFWPKCSKIFLTKMSKKNENVFFGILSEFHLY